MTIKFVDNSEMGKAGSLKVKDVEWAIPYQIFLEHS